VKESGDESFATDSASGTQSDVSKLLRAYRQRSGLSQTQLAELAQMSPAAIGALEQGSRRAPYRQTVVMLADALNLTSQERSTFEAAADQARSKSRTLALGSSPSLTLPTSSSPFIERDETLKIIALLSEHRLVTITGSAGVGKTRTALEAGKQQGDDAFFVDLSATARDGLIVAEFASALGIVLGTDPRQIETLVRTLSPKRCLLVIDNCEHVIAETSGVIDQLLRSCSQVKVLATSRERLGLSSEIVYRLPSLASPPDNITLADGRHYAALELFIARTRAADIHFNFSASDIAIAARICRGLEGIPLAIELAAARVPALGLRTVEARISDLATPYAVRDWPRRHQTMLAALAWSYDILDDPEKRLLRRLSVFSGGFTLDAAEQVCADEALSASHISTLTVQLVRKSLIDVTYDGGNARYSLLDSVRSFGELKLAEDESVEANSRRHVAWVLTYAAALHQKNVVNTENKPRDLENARAAIRFCLSSNLESDAVIAASIIGFGRHLWTSADRLQELRRLIDEVLPRLDESRHGEIVATLYHSKLRVVPMSEAVDLADRAAMLAAAAGEYRSALAISSFRAVTLWHAGRHDDARIALQGAELFLPRVAEIERSRMLFAYDSAWIACESGDLQTARRQLLEGTRIMRAVGDDSGEPQRANIAAEIEAAGGNWDGAIEIVEAFLSLATSSGRWNAQEIAYMHEFVAGCDVIVGKIDAAKVSARIYYGFWREVREITMTFGLIDTFAAVALSGGRPDVAARLLGSADALYVAGGTARVRVPQQVHDVVLEATRRIQSEPDFNMHHETGSKFSFDEICEEVDALLLGCGR
jgi:predicted ATPase/DNA-binding XRE family transcriptional regulator